MSEQGGDFGNSLIHILLNFQTNKSRENTQIYKSFMWIKLYCIKCARQYCIHRTLLVIIRN